MPDRHGPALRRRRTTPTWRKDCDRRDVARGLSRTMTSRLARSGALLAIGRRLCLAHGSLPRPRLPASAAGSRSRAWRCIWAKDRWSSLGPLPLASTNACWYGVRNGAAADLIRRPLRVDRSGTGPPGRPDHDESTDHGTQKPVECHGPTRSRNHTGDVYDPFVGSGTTIIAAEQLGRRCYAMEIDARYASWRSAGGRTSPEAGGQLADRRAARRRGCDPKTTRPTRPVHPAPARLPLAVGADLDAPIGEVPAVNLAVAADAEREPVGHVEPARLVLGPVLDVVSINLARRAAVLARPAVAGQDGLAPRPKGRATGGRAHGPARRRPSSCRTRGRPSSDPSRLASSRRVGCGSS